MFLVIPSKGGENADRGPAMKKLYHLGGHLPGKETDSLGDHPVVAGSDDNHLVAQPNIKGSGYRRQSGRDWLEHAKTALRRGPDWPVAARPADKGSRPAAELL